MDRNMAVEVEGLDDDPDHHGREGDVSCQKSAIPYNKSPAKIQAHNNERPLPSFRTQLEEACQWFLQSPDCITFSRPTSLCYDVPAKLQDGPQCGIVALWMAAKTLASLTRLTDGPAFPEVQDVQQRAVDMGYSFQGEMFSCGNLAALSNEMFRHFDLEAHVIALAGHSESCGGSAAPRTGDASQTPQPSLTLTSFEDTLRFFADSDRHQMLLVPYDSDSDHRPCHRRGHRAHWCLLSGLVTLVDHGRLVRAAELENGAFDNSGKVAIISRGAMAMQPSAAGKAAAELLRHSVFAGDHGGGVFFLVARQSKSRRYFLFDPVTLTESNANLKEVDPGKASSSRYVIPPGGLTKGLSRQAVVLRTL